MRPHELLPALFGAVGITALALVGLPSSTPHTLVTSLGALSSSTGVGTDVPLWH